MLQYIPIETEQVIQQIIVLQRENLTKNLDRAEIASQGFVTVEHDPTVLKKMNDLEQGVAIRDGDKIVGYCLAMVREFAGEIIILENLFKKLDTLNFKGQLLSNLSYIVVGQVCIAKSHRGRGLFDTMYEAYRKLLSPKYEYAVTEIAGRNLRSLKAHQRVGFKTLLEYTNEEGEDWVIVIWDWR